MKKFLEISKNRKIFFGIIIAIFLVAGGFFAYSYENQVMPQVSIHFLNDVSLPVAGQKVLIFSPHPDDESIGAGGFIYDSEKNGAEVRVVLVTNGNKHGLMDKRYAEFRKATATLGVSGDDLVFLNHEDGALNKYDSTKLYDEFKSEIDSYHPDYVLSTDTADTHPDHAKTGETVQKVLQGEHFSGHSYYFLVHFAKFPQPKKYLPADFLLPPIKLIQFDKEWQRFMLSSETEDKKYQAIESYQSQLKTPILRSVILSNIRKNELYSVEGGQ